jgi:hypothetical protein
MEGFFMERLKILDGPYKGLHGDGFYFKDHRCYSVKIPSRHNPEITEIFPPESVIAIGSRRLSILEKKEFIKMHQKADEVQLIGCKGACGSVWCSECYKRKGGSKRFANRLAELDYRATRQVVLTVDLKKFNGSGQEAFETLKAKKAVSQFIHDLKRTSKIEVKDWVWILEWHSDGSPHWHLFIQTENGKKGRIGNKHLLAHWNHGLVFESYIKSRSHWGRFVDYFGANGYFNPKQSTETKNKLHQLSLPEWAKKVTYRIRKTGGMAKKKDSSQEIPTAHIIEIIEDTIGWENKEEVGEEKTYEELLDSCGQSTFCQIRRGRGSLIWKRLHIPYRSFKEIAGEYEQGVGYIVQMKLWEFFLLIGIFDDEIMPQA